MKSRRQTKEEKDEQKLGDDSAALGEASSAAESMTVCDGGNDREDADSSSGSEPPSSSSQGTSGGAGYSGDYSSISDSSDTGGSQSKPAGVMISEPILKNSGSTNTPSRARRSQKRPNKRVGVDDVILPVEDLLNEHIHQHHHHRNLHGHHHHQPIGSNASSLYSHEANSDEDVNRKINEIMNLYKVSLQAQRDIKNAARAHLKVNAEAAKQAAAALSNQPLQVENSQPQNVLSTASQKMQFNQGEATNEHDGHMDSSECYANLLEACRK